MAWEARAEPPCTGVAADLSAAQKADYATLVAEVVGHGVKPSEIVLYRYLRSGDWSAVHAGTPRTDPGVLFFQEVDGHKRFKEAWGGWASPSDQPALAKWARRLGAPTDLARCFAYVVTH